jgi:hypothetical protein
METWKVERATRLRKTTPKAFARHGGPAEQAARQAGDECAACKISTADYTDATDEKLKILVVISAACPPRAGNPRLKNPFTG